MSVTPLRMNGTRWRKADGVHVQVLAVTGDTYRDGQGSQGFYDAWRAAHYALSRQTGFPCLAEYHAASDCWYFSCGPVGQ